MEFADIARSKAGKYATVGVGSIVAFSVLTDNPDHADGTQPSEAISCGEKAQLELKDDERVKIVGVEGRLPGGDRGDEPGRGILTATLGENAVQFSVSSLRKIGNAVDLTDPGEFPDLQGKTVYAQDGDKLFGSPAINIKNSEREMRAVGEVVGHTGEDPKAIVEVEVHCYDDDNRSNRDRNDRDR